MVDGESPEKAPPRKESYRPLPGRAPDARSSFLCCPRPGHFRVVRRLIQPTFVSPRPRSSPARSMSPERDARSNAVLPFASFLLISAL